MGLLVDGVWQDDVSRTKDGHFIRPAAQFRNWVTPDGSAGPSGENGFAAESGRYHLYVSLACPWAHRTIIFRKLKGLENVISLSIVSPHVDRDGWTFNKAEGSTGDDLYGKSKLSEIYLLANPRYSGRVSVPVLWDKKRKTIVNNESPEIIRMHQIVEKDAIGRRPLLGRNLACEAMDRARADCVCIVECTGEHRLPLLLAS